MKKTAIAAAVLLATGNAYAATTHTMTNGTFTFYDSGGVEQTAFGHNDVQGTFDLVNGSGGFTTSTPFSGETWVADINGMAFHSSAMGGTSTAPEAQSYTWTTQSYYVAGVGTVTCRVAGSIDNCTGATGLFLGSTTDSYSYSLSPGQFAAHTFFDWSTNLDIPVLAVLQITSGNPFTGPATVVSVDSDGDGVPGTKMLTPPFANQTAAFSGTIVPVPSAIPVPAAVWLFGSGLLGLVGVARRKKA